MKREVLCIVHSQTNNLGRFADVLQRQKAKIRRVNFVDGDRVQDPPGAFRGIIVFGGTASVADGLGSEFREEYRYLERAIQSGAPVLGICLGGQILSEIHGGGDKIKSHERPEIGFKRISSTEHASSGFWSHDTFFQWHWDDMPCPSSGKILGSTVDFECQAFTVGNCLALQFHPDATAETVRAWAEFGSETFKAHSDVTVDELVHVARAHESAINGWTTKLVKDQFGFGDSDE